MGAWGTHGRACSARRRRAGQPAVQVAGRAHRVAGISSAIMMASPNMQGPVSSCGSPCASMGQAGGAGECVGHGRCPSPPCAANAPRLLRHVYWRLLRATSTAAGPQQPQRSKWCPHLEVQRHHVAPLQQPHAVGLLALVAQVDAWEDRGRRAARHVPSEVPLPPVPLSTSASCPPSTASAPPPHPAPSPRAPAWGSAGCASHP